MDPDSHRSVRRLMASPEAGRRLADEAAMAIACLYSLSNEARHAAVSRLRELASFAPPEHLRVALNRISREL